MSQDEARELLEQWINHVTQGGRVPIVLPIYDQVCISNWKPNEISEYSFRYLICKAYNLQEK